MLSAVSSLVSGRVNTHSIHTHTQQGFIQRGKGGISPPILNVSPSNRKILYAIFRNRAKFRDWWAYYYIFICHISTLPWCTDIFPPQAENPAWIPAQCTHTHTVQTHSVHTHTHTLCKHTVYTHTHTHCANTQCTHTHTHCANTQCTHTHTLLQCTCTQCTHTVTHLKFMQEFFLLCTIIIVAFSNTTAHRVIIS